MELKHIDSGYYRLSMTQALQISSEHRLPRPGHEIRATLPADTILLHRAAHEGADWTPTQVDYNRRIGWVTRIQCSYHDGEEILSGSLLAFHFDR